MPGKPKSIDDYLARVPADRQRALKILRATIHSLLPDAEECISYSMPAFRYQGHVVAGFLATGKGCSYFPFSGTTLATLAGDLRGYGQTKSALHFEPEKPLSKALVKKLLQARIAETQAPRAKTNGAAAASRSRSAKTNGAAAASRSRSAKTNGADTASRSRSAKTDGAGKTARRSPAPRHAAVRGSKAKRSRAVFDAK